MCLQYHYELLLNFLKVTVNSNYVYLDVPGYFNVGDNIICLGSLKLLQQIPFKCDYASTIGNFSQEKIKPSACIIMQGGGNFGDLYPGANWFRNYIVEHFPNNRIIFMPQSITYNDKNKIVEDAMVCAKHPDLHIVARDNESYLILKEHFSANQLYLLPDSAIGLYKQLPKIGNIHTNKKLFIVRKDFEIGDLDENSITGDKKDWDDILNTPIFNIERIGLRIIHYIKKRTKLNFLHNLSNWYYLKVLYPTILKITSATLLKYSSITTTRLHGYIYAQLLHIPVSYIDTKYKKISNYISTWKR